MNKTTNCDFTVIIPVYNEEDNIGRLEQEMLDFLSRASRKSCVLFVNDGSADSSLWLIQEQSQNSSAGLQL